MSTNLVFVFAAYMEYAVVTVLSRHYKKKKIKKARQQAEEEAQVIKSMTIARWGCMRVRACERQTDRQTDRQRQTDG